MQKRFCATLVLVTFIIGSGLLAGCQKLQGPSGEARKVTRPYEAMDFSRLNGMEGFSEALLKTHFSLYQGYVKNTNLLFDQIDSLVKTGRTNSPEYSEIKRRLGFEFNGMRLHEYYFANLGGRQVLDPATPLFSAIVQNFGSFDMWRKDFAATGSMRGVGWAVLYVDSLTGRLINFWINEHEVNHPAGCKPILVMDVWEHAYLMDHQLDRAKYIDAFFQNIEWGEVSRRYESSMQPTVETHPLLGDPGSKTFKQFQQHHET